jgi:hypothetical protein
MTELRSDPSEFSYTPLQLMKLRGASQEEIRAYEERQKRRKSKDWGGLVTVTPKPKSSSTSKTKKSK